MKNYASAPDGRPLTWHSSAGSCPATPLLLQILRSSCGLKEEAEQPGEARKYAQMAVFNLFLKYGGGVEILKSWRKEDPFPPLVVASSALDKPAPHRSPP